MLAGRLRTKGVIHGFWLGLEREWFKKINSLRGNQTILALMKGAILLKPTIRPWVLAMILGLMTALLMGIGFPAAAAGLFSDDFEDGNSTGWGTSGGSWSVVTDGNKVYKQSSTSATTHAYNGTGTWADYSVQARAKVLSFNGTNRYFGLLARYQSSSNYYYLVLTNAGKLEIRKKVSGSSTTLASKTYTVTTGFWYTLKLVLSGSALQAYVNGVAELSATDSSLATGKVGLTTVNASAEFDDLLVESDSGQTPTPTPASATPTPTATPVATPTPTPSTATPTPTPPTATPTPTPVPATPTPTPTPSAATPTPTPVSGVGTYYVAPFGNDSNPGTLAQPFYTVARAVAAVSAGDTVYVRGGTYAYTQTVVLDRSGTAAAPIRIWAYPGEQPVLDYSGMTYATQDERALMRGMIITGDYWHIKGLEIQYAADNGIKIEGSYNTVEGCVFHHCKDSGLQIGLAKEDSNPGNIAAYNSVINCDSYRNFDEYTKGGNADGFACKLSPGHGNYFYGCRAWENSDDGYDFYHTYLQIVVENCWTWHNGDQAVFGYTGSWSGNGQGFKLGDGNAPHLIKNSVAFDHKYTDGNNKGFDQNSNEGPVTVLNCTGWGNEINFYFGSGHAANVLKNNVGFAWTSKNVSIVDESTQANNSWNLTVTADAADFLSLAPELAKAPRNADGSLPNNGFAKLTAGSDLINKGVDVGIPYLGSAPDLGAYERE